MRDVVDEHVGYVLRSRINDAYIVDEYRLIFAWYMQLLDAADDAASNEVVVCTG